MMHPPPSLAAVLTLEDCSNSRLRAASTRILASPTLSGISSQTQESNSLLNPLSYHHLAPTIMREEVNAAVEFFLKMVETPQLSTAMPRLGRNLSKVLSNKYKDHWFINSPQRGQAYRCIEVCDSQGEDRVLAEAAAASGLRYSELRLPADLCVWVDPKEVACRFGDELGSFLPIYINENGKKRNFVDKFKFDRLCERTAPNGPLIVGRGGRMTDRGVLRRVGSGGADRVVVEVERGALVPSPSTSVSLVLCEGGGSALLTPPSTPPQSPDHSSSSPRSPFASPVLFSPAHTADSHASPTKLRHSPTHHNLHHLNNNNNNNMINSSHQRNKHYQQHVNMNQYNSNNLHSRSPPQHQFHHHNQQQQMSVSPTHHYHHNNVNINNNNNNNNSHFHSSSNNNYNTYNNSNGSNLNSNTAFYGSSNGNGFSRSPPRYNGFSGGKPPAKWGPHHGSVFPSSVANNNNIHHHLHNHHHHHQQEQQQQYYLQQKREVDSPRWLWQGRRTKV